VETPHPVETKHAYCVFSFHVTKSFQDNFLEMHDTWAADGRATPGSITIPLSLCRLIALPAHTLLALRVKFAKGRHGTLAAP